MSIMMNKESVEVIPHSCLVKLQAIYDTLKSAEKKAADLLLQEPKFFSESSIVEAAEAAGCSEATIVRLSKKLGYSGYPELKAHLVQGNGDRPMELYAGITEEDTYESVVHKVFQASIQALTDTMNIIDKGEYQRAVEAIVNSRKMVLCGVGDAANVALSGYQKFIRAGMNVQASHDPDVQLIAASHLTKGDVIIAISYSGRTKSIVDLVKYSKVTGATTICITNYPLSPLAKNSDIILLTAAFTEPLKGEVVSKRVTELCLMESLFINVLLKKKEQFTKGLNKSSNALEMNKL